MIKTNAIILLAALVSLGCPLTLHGQPLIIKLKDSEIKIFDSMVKIADVATVESKNKRVAMKVSELDLDKLEAEGDQVTIDRKQIEMRIRVSDYDSHPIRTTGSAQVTVTRVANINPAKILKDATAKAISQQFGLNQSDIRVSLTDKSNTPKMKSLATMIDNAIVVLPASLPLGESKIRFVYQDDQDADQSVEIKCRVTVLTEMVIANRTIPARTAISKEDVKVVKRPLEDNRLNPASLKDVIGKTSRNIVSIHGVIRTSDVTDSAPKPIVNRNDIVDVQYIKGPLSARFKNVRVLNSGAVGDPVEFINPESQKKVIARVVDETLIEVRR